MASHTVPTDEEEVGPGDQQPVAAAGIIRASGAHFQTEAPVRGAGAHRTVQQGGQNGWCRDKKMLKQRGVKAKGSNKWKKSRKRECAVLVSRRLLECSYTFRAKGTI